MSKTKSPILAIAVGAVIYVVVSLIRDKLLQNFGVAFNGGSISPVDASVVFLITLSSGFVAALFYQKHVLILGFVTGAIAEILRGFVHFFVSSLAAMGWSGLTYGIPTVQVMHILGSAIPSGILGAAGAAVAVVLFQKKNA